MKNIRTIFITFLIILAIVISCRFLYPIALSHLIFTSPPYQDSILTEKVSPNHEFKLVEIERDSGATGGAVMIFVERVKKRHTLSFRRKLYIGDWGERPKFNWIDNRKVQIDGKELDIFRPKVIWDFPDSNAERRK